MNRLLLSIGIGLFLIGFGLLGAISGQTQTQTGFLSALKQGDNVVIKETAGKYQITYHSPDFGTSKILEIGTDYILVEDLSRVMKTWIPVYSIQCISKFPSAK